MNHVNAVKQKLNAWLPLVTLKNAHNKLLKVRGFELWYMF